MKKPTAIASLSALVPPWQAIAELIEAAFHRSRAGGQEQLVLPA
jgi:hypothetical protein